MFFTCIFFFFVFVFFFFFFNDTATTEIYTVYNTLSLHDALPIDTVRRIAQELISTGKAVHASLGVNTRSVTDRSEEHTSELQSLYTISYAVFCLKKKKTPQTTNSLALSNRKKKKNKK